VAICKRKYGWVKKGGCMKCPKCGREMSIGISHDERYDAQYECQCGYCECFNYKEE